jgi:hypothetical protein
MTTPTKTPRTRPLRIGCATGFWGDSEAGAAQLVLHGNIDYLVFDFLAEITMSLLARARAKSPDAGYAPDFVRTIAALAGELKSRGIKVVSNAGGVNPRACAEALARQLQLAGVDLKIAVVEGDDLSTQAGTFRQDGVREMFSDAAMPSQFLSVNAYLGAQPIAAFDLRQEVLGEVTCAELADTVDDLLVVRVHVLVDVRDARLACRVDHRLRSFQRSGGVDCALCGTRGCRQTGLVGRGGLPSHTEALLLLRREVSHARALEGRVGLGAHGVLIGHKLLGVDRVPVGQHRLLGQGRQARSLGDLAVSQKVSQRH